MPSDIGYPVPGLGQRPQIVNRLAIEEPKELIQAKDEEGLVRSGVEESKVKSVTATREVLDDRFPTETQVDRFRGNTEGRELKEVPASLPISRLPNTVQAFNPLTARSTAMSSLSIAESAATGLTKANPQINIGVASSQTGDFRVGSDNGNTTQQPRYPSINGSGEIAARFDSIEDRIRQRALDEFDGLRPGGPESERVSQESSQVDQRNQDTRREAVRVDSLQEQSVVGQRRQDLIVSENQQAIARQEQVRIEEQVNEQAVNDRVQPEEINSTQASQAPVTKLPGESTNTRGEPLNSEEQREVQRLARRDREIRSHEQAHTRAGGAHTRGGVKRTTTAGLNGRQYATSGENNTGLNTTTSPEATVSNGQQVQRAALATSNLSNADRSVTSVGTRSEFDAPSPIKEFQELDKTSVIKDQVDGKIASKQVSNEQASEVEVRENVDHFAGAQSVVPDPSFSQKSAEPERQSLESAEGTYPISTPESTSRPVTAPAKNLDIEEQAPPPASPRSESTSAKYDEALEKALARD
jgi:hypothetical protein